MLLCLMLACARAEAPATPSGDAPALVPTAAQRQAGRLQISLACENNADADRTVLLLDPLVNGEIASFGNGWGSDEITLAAGQASTEVVELVSDRPDATVESASFRIACDGTVSAPLALEYVGDDWRLRTADAPGEADIPPLLAAGAACPAPAGIALTDRLTEEQAALLDVGEAVVCLKVEDDAGVSYMPFCRVRMAVDGQGNARAIYSGVAPVFSADPATPIATAEDGRGETIACEAAGVELSGDAVYYAELSFGVRMDETGGVAIESTLVDSPELGGPCRSCPRDLFAQARVHHPCLRFEEKDGWTETRETGGRTAEYDLDEPLTVDLVPAAGLGEVCVYYEYWFTDGSMLVREPTPLMP